MKKVPKKQATAAPETAETRMAPSRPMMADFAPSKYADFISETSPRPQKSPALPAGFLDSRLSPFKPEPIWAEIPDNALEMWRYRNGIKQNAE